MRLPILLKMLISRPEAVRPTTVTAMELCLAGKWHVAINRELIAQPTDVIDVMARRLERDDPGIVEKAVDDARRRVAAQQHSRLADAIGRAADCGDDRRQRLCVVEIEDQRRRG